MQRLERQAQVYREVFGEISHDPPPYPFSRSESVKSQSTIRSSSSSVPPPQYSKVNEGHSDHSRFRPGPEGAILPKDSLILVTAANSFQGIQIVDQLLAHGYRVRGAVRDAAKAVWTSKLFKHKYGPGRYTTSIVSDMVPRNAYDLAVRSCAGVIHCASVTKLDPDPTKTIAPSIAGALNALASASRESSVKRFVYCSALTAAVDPTIGRLNHVTYESWNMECFQAAWNGPISNKAESDMERAWSVQCAAKFQTEQAVWRWYREQRPEFDLNTGEFVAQLVMRMEQIHTSLAASRKGHNC
jgi:NAD(P)-dependent dehydrogenase (short-subunit alcohol dehydrogenase family)